MTFLNNHLWDIFTGPLACTAESVDIVVLSGIQDVKIGDTICTEEYPKTLDRITLDYPTISMEFTINTSPLSGKEGSIVPSGKIC